MGRGMNGQALLVGVGAIVLRDGLVLLGRRIGSHGAGTWALPGGHLELGESVAECAAREVREEAGLELEAIGPGPYTSDVFASEGKHYITLFVVAQSSSGHPVVCEPDKCAGWQWFLWSALPQPLFQPLATLHASGFVPGQSAQQALVSFAAAEARDAEELAALRIDAMRESLERIGRFDPTRARERFLSGFAPADTRHIVVAGARVGFVVVKRQNSGLLLDHLYVRPTWQGRGIGSAVLARVFGRADAERLDIRVSALRGSASNRFYTRHGFERVEQSEFDNHYVRTCQNAP